MSDNMNDAKARDELMAKMMMNELGLARRNEIFTQHAPLPRGRIRQVEVVDTNAAAVRDAVARSGAHASWNNMVALEDSLDDGKPKDNDFKEGQSHRLGLASALHGERDPTISKLGPRRNLPPTQTNHGSARVSNTGTQHTRSSGRLIRGPVRETRANTGRNRTAPYSKPSSFRTLGEASTLPRPRFGQGDARGPMMAVNSKKNSPCRRSAAPVTASHASANPIARSNEPSNAMVHTSVASNNGSATRARSVDKPAVAAATPAVASVKAPTVHANRRQGRSKSRYQNLFPGPSRQPAEPSSCVKQACPQTTTCKQTFTFEPLPTPATIRPEQPRSTPSSTIPTPTEDSVDELMLAFQATSMDSQPSRDRLISNRNTSTSSRPYTAQNSFVPRAPEFLRHFTAPSDPSMMSTFSDTNAVLTAVPDHPLNGEAVTKPVARQDIFVDLSEYQGTHNEGVRSFGRRVITTTDKEEGKVAGFGKKETVKAMCAPTENKSVHEKATSSYDNFWKWNETRMKPATNSNA